MKNFAPDDCCNQISLTRAKKICRAKAVVPRRKIAIRVLQNDEIRTGAIPPWMAPRSKL